MYTFVRRIRGALAPLADLVFPPRCTSCDALLEKRTALCEVCLRTCQTVGSPRCPTCARPRPAPRGVSTARGVDDLCSVCASSPPPQSAATARWRYTGAIADALQRGKYAGEPWRLAALGRMLGAWLTTPDTDTHDRTDVIRADRRVRLAPVPSHPTRRGRRGYNPAAVLADAALREAGLDRPPNPVEKYEETPPQAGLSRTQRLENVRGAFRPQPDIDPIAGTWLLVDDIMTTGATVAEVAGALLDAGADRVVAVVAARATRGGPRG